MNHERSCGAVLYTLINDVPYYVLVQGSYFGFPKGHMEAGESERRTALREVKEETGIDAVLVSNFRRIVRYKIAYRPNTVKTVVYFLAYYEGQEIAYQKEELRGAVLVPYEEALKLVTLPRLREILKGANREIRRLQEKATDPNQT